MVYYNTALPNTVMSNVTADTNETVTEIERAFSQVSCVTSGRFRHDSARLRAAQTIS